LLHRNDDGIVSELQGHQHQLTNRSNRQAPECAGVGDDQRGDVRTEIDPNDMAEIIVITHSGDRDQN
jgi:hypothetical protein